MTHVQNYSTANNILADFVTNLCFDEQAKINNDNWFLVYPDLQDKEEAYAWIKENRRATVGTSFVPESTWINNEVAYIDAAFLNRFNDEQFYEEEFVIDNELSNSGDTLKINLSRTIISTDGIVCSVDNVLFDYNDSIAFVNGEFTVQGNCAYFDINDFTNGSVVKIKYQVTPLVKIMMQEMLFSNDTVKVKAKDAVEGFYNSNNLNTLSVMEFYIDGNNIYIRKDALQAGTTLLISYQTMATKAETWFVDFDYPKHYGSSINYSFFEWSFGKELDEDNHIINDKVKSIPKFQCFWQTMDKDEMRSDEWFPLEYFMSWDDSAISFMVTEDVITDVRNLIHSFNYIGAISSIKTADYDDINGNFGSCGSYSLSLKDSHGEINKQYPDDVIESSIKFVERQYNSYFEPEFEKTLLEVDNAHIANCQVDTDMINEMNLLQPMIQEASVDGTYVTYANPPTPIATFAGQPIERNNRLYKEISAKLKISNGTNITFNNKLYTLLEDTYIKLTSNIQCTINAGTTIAPLTTNIGSIDHPVILENSITGILNMSDGNLYIPANTQIVYDSQIYTTPYQCPIYAEKVLVPSSTIIVSDGCSAIRTGNNYEQLDIGNTFSLKNNTTVQLKYRKEYIVEFQYRAPFKGKMIYNFLSLWYNGNVYVGVQPHVLTGATPVRTPIVPERLIDNSTYIGKTIIPSELINTEEIDAGVLMEPLILSREDNNNFHVHTLEVPDEITNELTEEGWSLSEIYTDPLISHEDNSVTNICTYPNQVIVTNVCYTKHQPFEAELVLQGIHDSEFLRIVLIDEDNNVLVDWGNNGSYKNLDVTYLNDRIKIKLNTNNLNNEIVYLGVYKLNNYMSSESYESIKHVTRPGGCACTNMAYIPYDGTHDGYNRFTEWAPDPTHNNERSWASDHSVSGCGFIVDIEQKLMSYPIDVQLNFIHRGTYSEPVTRYHSIKNAFSTNTSVPTLYFSPAHKRVYESDFINLAKSQGIISNVNAMSDIYYPEIHNNTTDSPTANAVIDATKFLKINLNDNKTPFTPQFISGKYTEHIWIPHY